MAMGRAEGEKRVENAIKNALDSPLLYGTDITRAKRILFNIYSSDDTPIMVPEMQEIDDFFDSLNPNIEVIWGISSDNTLGADAKVTILATGMEEIGNCQEEMKDDDYYEDLIRQLYRPIMKKEETVESEPIFIVATPPDPEPSDLEPTAGPYTSYTERMKQWITKILKDTEE